MLNRRLITLELYYWRGVPHRSVIRFYFCLFSPRSMTVACKKTCTILPHENEHE